MVSRKANTPPNAENAALLLPRPRNGNTCSSGHSCHPHLTVSVAANNTNNNSNNNNGTPLSSQQYRKRKKYAKKACASCKKAHTQCGDARPCPRCKRLGKECVDVSDNSSADASRGNAAKINSAINEHSNDSFSPNQAPTAAIPCVDDITPKTHTVSASRQSTMDSAAAAAQGQQISSATARGNFLNHHPTIVPLAAIPAAKKQQQPQSVHHATHQPYVLPHQNLLMSFAQMPHVSQLPIKDSNDLERRIQHHKHIIAIHQLELNKLLRLKQQQPLLSSNNQDGNQQALPQFSSNQSFHNLNSPPHFHNPLAVQTAAPGNLNSSFFSTHANKNQNLNNIGGPRDPVLLKMEEEMNSLMRRQAGLNQQVNNTSPNNAPSSDVTVNSSKNTTPESTHSAELLSSSGSPPVVIAATNKPQISGHETGFPAFLPSSMHISESLPNTGSIPTCSQNDTDSNEVHSLFDDISFGW